MSAITSQRVSPEDAVRLGVALDASVEIKGPIKNMTRSNMGRVLAAAATYFTARNRNLEAQSKINLDKVYEPDLEIAERTAQAQKDALADLDKAYAETGLTCYY